MTRPMIAATRISTPITKKARLAPPLDVPHAHDVHDRGPLALAVVGELGLRPHLGQVVVVDGTMALLLARLRVRSSHGRET